MPSPKQLAAKVELFEMMPGIYILRLNDMRFQPSALKVAGSLPAGAVSIAVVTPTDTKVFNLAGTNPVEEEVEISDAGDVVPMRARLRTDGTETNSIPESSSGDPMEDAMKLANLDEPATSPENAEENKPKIRRRGQNQKADVSPNSDCGRCGGSGSVQIVNANNEADSAACPVCKGSGQIHRAGRRR